MEVKRKVRAVERHDDYLWVRLMEGRKSGLDFAVPDDVDLEVGNVCEATFKPLNEKRTAWKIVSY